MEVDANLVAQLSKDEVVRHITQVHHNAIFQASTHMAMPVLLQYISIHGIVPAHLKAPTAYMDEMQVFCLERLAAKDLITARSVLGAMVQARRLPLWALPAVIMLLG